ncbi:hypothetical protein [Cellulosimicrobium cellulans]|uniref:Uncharacterized protein n=1 Tax=Cellulosimicrobium cellulans TaxID=1710 RepID=A0A4Y4E021_CELCE|nr:hypothetical protein [Cellulosimicrobium cellulans]GED09175.1 hypothetical protein CCE02nite_11740 [Cellulosimicrobium cellulans]
MPNSTHSTPAETVAVVIDAATGGTLAEVALSAAVDEAVALANAGSGPRAGLTLAEAVAVALDVHLGDLDDETFAAVVDDVVDAVTRHSARA